MPNPTPTREEREEAKKIVVKWRKTRDPDVLALVAACKALERSSSTRMIVVNLRLLWDRYLVHPPAGAWWVRLDAKRPTMTTPPGRGKERGDG